MPLIRSEQIEGGAGVNGGVFVTNIVPTSSGNVGSKTWTSDTYALLTCLSDTDLITVSILAITGDSHMKPIVTVNGNNVTLSGSTGDTIFTGTIAIDLAGSNDVEVIHEDGATWDVTVSTDTPPVILSANYTGAYPGAQTQLKENDTFTFNVVSDVDVVQIEIENYGAFKTQTPTFGATTSYNGTGTIDDEGNTSVARGFKIRVKKSTGSWSDWHLTENDGSVDGTNKVFCNNIHPTINITTITYPATQEAIKDVETATVANTITNYDTVAYTSPGGQLTITNDTTHENPKTVTRLAGNYNISVDNFTITANRAANDADSSSSECVYIAHTDCVISISSPTRLRSGGNVSTSAQNHTITITSTQNLIVAPTLTAPTGAWQGGAFAGGPTAWTRALQIHDTDTKGTPSFNTLVATNLARKVQNAINSGAAYVVGGFVFRTMTIAAWTNREGSIGTQVADTGKLRCTNLSKGVSGSLNYTFRSSVGNQVDYYTITEPTGVYNAAGNLWYNCDAANATSNTTGTQQIELEEVI